MGIFYHLRVVTIISVLKDLFRSGYLSSRVKSIGCGSYVRKNVRVLGAKYISIGNHSVIGENTILTAWDKYYPSNNGILNIGRQEAEIQLFTPTIKIGDGVNIGPMSHITAIDCIIIGNGVLTGPQVLITDNSHGLFEEDQLQIRPADRPLYSKGPVVIEENVWIGQGSMILSGLTIGKGSIVAANSVVTKSVPPFSLVAGNPAKVIKTISKQE